MAENIIYETLLTLEESFGRKTVEFYCKKFLKAPIRKNINSTKRKTVPKSWTREAWQRQEGICARCGFAVPLKDATGDHKISVVGGGDHTPENIAALHKSCNSSKGANSLDTESKKSGRLYTDILK